MAVKSLLHYALEVPEPVVGERFYEAFGLQAAGSMPDALGLRPAAGSRPCVVLYGGPRKRLHHLAFGAPGDEYDATRAALHRAGVAEVDPPRGLRETRGLWVRDPDGNLVNILPEPGDATRADAPLAVNGPGRAARVAVRGCPDRAAARPRRLGHVLLFSADLGRQIDFYTRALGLRLSDTSGATIAFLRCSPDHHNLALLASPGPGFHHGSFEVGSVDELAMGAERLHAGGVSPGWGPGRHVIGSNYFYYARDPWGSWAEYFHDLDVIPEDCAWQPRDFPPEDALFRWGPPLPADFGDNRELASPA